jgi:hypothetical protein
MRVVTSSGFSFTGAVLQGITDSLATAPYLIHKHMYCLTYGTRVSFL